MIRLITAGAVLGAAGLVVAVTPSSAHALHCDKPASTWTITDIERSYANTGLRSDWTYLPDAPRTVHFDRTASARVDARVSPGLLSDAAAVFAAAAAAIDVPVTQRWSTTDSWTLSADIPQDAVHLYRLRQQQETRTFTATNHQLNAGTCRYVRQHSGTGQMPRAENEHLVWDTERIDA